MKTPYLTSEVLKRAVVLLAVLLLVMVALLTILATKRQPSFNSNYEVRLKADVTNSLLTKVSLYNGQTGVETPYLTLPDIFRDNYHAAEFKGGALYILKRIGMNENLPNNNDWTDELWKYDSSGQGKKLYSVKGLDFRVSAEAARIAVFQPAQGKSTVISGDIVLTDLQGKILKRIDGANFTGALGDKALGLLFWQKESIWFETYQGQLLTDVYELNAKDFSIASYEVSSLKATASDSILEPTSKTLAYSDFRDPFDYDPAVGFVKQTVSLYLYNLSTGKNSTLLTASVAHPFEPKWLDEHTLEYNNPNGTGRTTIKTP